MVSTINSRSSYTLQFSFKLDADTFEGVDGSEISPDDAVANITVMFVRDQISWFIPPTGIPKSAIVAQDVILGPFRSAQPAPILTASLKLNGSTSPFSTDPYHVVVRVCLSPRIKPGVWTAWFKRPPNFILTDLFLTRDAMVMPLSRRLSSFSQLAVLREPPPLPRASIQQTNCPHRVAGLRSWASRTVWRKVGLPQPPAAGAAVVLPENQTIILRAAHVPAQGFDSITIPATSTLIFDDMPIDLRVRFIAIYGSLRIGSPTCRIKNPIRITLVGPATNVSDLPEGLGSKGIAVMTTGSLDIHGTRYRSWTRLAATAMSGDAFIQLQHPVNWVPGEEQLFFENHCPGTIPKFELTGPRRSICRSANRGDDHGLEFRYRRQHGKRSHDGPQSSRWRPHCWLDSAPRI
jgi:hypothetical protein